MIYTKDAAGYELNINDKVLAIKKEESELPCMDIVMRPILVKAKVYNICKKMIMVTDGTSFWRIYPNQCVKDFRYD